MHRPNSVSDEVNKRSTGARRNLILEDVVRRFSVDGPQGARAILDAARAAVAHGETVNVISAERGQIVCTLTSSADITSFEAMARRKAYGVMASASNGARTPMREP